jgi:hypothetical protein
MSKSVLDPYIKYYDILLLLSTGVVEIHESLVIQADSLIFPSHMTCACGFVYKTTRRKERTYVYECTRLVDTITLAVLIFETV